MRGSGPPRLLLRFFVQAPQRTVPNVVDVFGIANPTANVTVRVLGGTTYTAARKGD